ncbi:SRPBCC domain-containing protein [Gaoshiqia sp. Z1-71]|uniref:SRPBCC domain-containing protein n=1 Tax=Gaoshiqia hydrogeniformans TaxID=3290090 RepID=UPI003BF8ED4A
MKTEERTMITIGVTIHAPVEKVWKFWNEPGHITRWNAASDDWHCPRAENDLRPDGKIIARMEAKDGSQGFDFEGIYDEVLPHERIAYTLADGRKVRISFKGNGSETLVEEVFEAENVYPHEMQREGWQAILNNLKKYVEASTLHFEISIHAGAGKVYQTMLDQERWIEWTAEFNPTSSYKGSWEKGSKILFLGSDQDGNMGGMVSRIKENIPNRFISIEHLGIIQNDREITSGPEVDGWVGALENYSFTEQNGKTLLSVDLDTNEEFKSYFTETWPKALKKLKTICEN